MSNELERLEARRQRLNEQLANALERAPVTCCRCGGRIRVSFQSRPEGIEARCTPYEPLSDDEIGRLKAELFRVSSEIGKLKDTLKQSGVDHEPDHCI